MGRAPCCQRVRGEKKGPWTHEEDLRLTRYIEANGEGQWRTIPLKAGLDRCGKGCRPRWMNYLRPNVKRGNISKEEEELIIRLHKLLGNRWSLIAGRVPGRTDNEIKNYWNTHLSKTYNKERRTNFESSANPNDPFSTNSLEKSEAQNFQAVGEITETEPKTDFVSDFELQHLNCYYNLLNPSLENQGETWSSLNPTVEAWSGDIDGSWTQLGFVDLSSSPCLFDLSNSMQPTSLSGFEYDGFGDSCVQNQRVESTKSSVIDLSLFPPACFSAFMGLGQPELASFGDFQLETMSLLTGQMALGVDHYDGLETMMRNQFFLDGIM